MQDTMSAGRTRESVITGVFFIIATVSAIIGNMLYAPLLSGTDYLTTGYKYFNSIVGGATGELFTSCANIGTAIMLYPLLRRYNENVGLAYVCFRLLEVVFIIIGIVSVLSLLTLSESYASGTVDSGQAIAAGTVLRSAYKWCFILGPNFMLGINTSLYSYVLYKTNLVPKIIAATGFVGAILIFFTALLQMFGVIAQLSLTHIVLTIPVAVYEMLLAGFLITKGYRREGLGALGILKSRSCLHI